MSAFEWVELGLIHREIAQLREERRTAKANRQLYRAEQLAAELSRAEKHRDQLVNRLGKAIAGSCG
jgi:hypothetical protein